MRRLTVWLVLFFALLPVASLAYSVQVSKVSDFPKSFQKLAMLPASCAPGVDALWVESLLVGKFAERRLAVVPSVVVRQVMFDLGIKEITDENRKTLADKLNVDAFVVAAVDSAGTENAGAVGVMIGNIFTAVPQKRNVGAVQLAIVSAASGKTLMEGTGFGESTARSKRGVIGKTFSQILDKAFTPSFFSERPKP